MGLPQRKQFYEPAEYLAFERTAKFRHEYIGGEIYEMAGEKRSHSIICTNISGELHARLKGKLCEVYSPNMKVRTESSGIYTYPDATVVCGQPIFHDEAEDILINPKVIIEVLSPSTEKKDRGEKWENYQQIESLAEYLLVSQTKPRLEMYVRQPNQHWDWSYKIELTSSIYLASIDCELRLADIYDRIDFPPINRPTLVEDSGS